MYCIYHYSDSKLHRHTHMEGVETPLLQKQLLYHHLSGTDHLTPKDQCNTCVLFMEQVRSLYKTPNVQILLMFYIDKYFYIYIHISWWCINKRMAITARKVSDMIINARLSCLSVTSLKEPISHDFPESWGNICSFFSFSYLAFVSIKSKTIHISLCFYFLSWSLLALQQVQPFLNPNNSPKNVIDLPHKLFWIVKTWEDSIGIVITPTPRTQREVHVCDKDFLMKHLMWLHNQDCVTHLLPSPTTHWGVCDVHIGYIPIGILLRTYPEVS